MKKSELNDIKYWYPLVNGIVKTPKTIIISADNVEFIRMLDGETPDGFDDFILKLQDAIDIVGLPAFLRTGHTSAKHSWENSCFVNDIKKIGSHVYNIVEFSFCADLSGLPTNTWAVREILPIKEKFNAFCGNMPITRELRLFVDNGEIVHKQPYWPEDAINGHCDIDFKPLMKDIQTFADSEIDELSKLTIEINKYVPGHWSVDWLDTDDGWYMTDMAIGSMSYKWDYDWGN